jgi:uncharacterized membrane protein YidH (DUF202 family)
MIATWIIWILFGLLTAYLTYLNYYNKTSIIEWFGEKYGKPIRYILSIAFSIVYAILGPVGFIVILTINIENLMITKDKSIKFIR